jgi:cation:H+ antiporter
MSYINLLAGFIILLISGRFLVKGGVDLARKLNVSKLVIGVTVVSFGTSAPELFVSAVAAYNGHPELAIGNVFGSNIANISLVLAITALIIPIPVKKATVRIDTPIMLFVTILLYLAIRNNLISRPEGCIGVVLLVSYIVCSYFKGKNISVDEFEENKTYLHWSLAVLLIILSAAGLAIGSGLLVKNVSSIAEAWGINERIIAITVVAFGTSLPELVTSVIAAVHREMDISVGNIVGSNIFNILGVLGITSIIKDIRVDNQFIHIDFYWVLGISILLFIFILPLKGGTINRWKGLILLLVYVAYIYTIVI